MLVIKTYTNKKNNKIEIIGLIDRVSHEYKEFTVKKLSNLMLMGLNVDNAYIDCNGNFKLVNMNPCKPRSIVFDKKDNKWILGKTYKIRTYCIITSCNHGAVSFIACNSNGLIISRNLVAPSTMLEELEKSPDDIKIYNGYFEKHGESWYLYIFDKKSNAYLKVNSSNTLDPSTSILGNWTADIIDIEENGIAVMNLESNIPSIRATIPDKVFHIENFLGIVNELIIPSNVISLGKACFTESDSLLRIKFGTGLKIIPSEICKNTVIEQINFSGSEVLIGESAFEDCERLRGVLVTNAEIIERSAFENTSLSRINLLNINIIKGSAFAFNDKLKVAKLGDKLSVIGPKAFMSCSHLTSVEIPSTVNRIHNLAFAGCNKLKEVRLPKSVKTDSNSFDRHTKIVYY